MNKPIGIIDSGIGGLTVATEIIRQLSKESIVYIGDSARCPYGPRSREEVRRFTWQMIDRLLEADVKMIVIACNTATAVVLEEARNKLPIPVVGVIRPGAISAIQASERGEIAVIGTSGTIDSGAYTVALTAIKGDVVVESLACPLFVPLVEQGIVTGPEALAVVKQSLAPLQTTTFDTLILGCTHYPLLTSVIASCLPPHVKIISSAKETAREVSSLLFHYNQAQQGDVMPTYRFYTTGDAAQFKQLAAQSLHVETGLVVEVDLASRLPADTYDHSIVGKGLCS
ncbi:glutamate racemase [Bacillus sp. FSL W7-1360]